MSALAPTLEVFFTERLIRQRQVSPNTVAAYRDTMRLLLGFAAERLGKQPPNWKSTTSAPRSIGAFLDHLEPSGATACAPATPVWQRFDPFFATRRCATPSTPP